MDFRVLEYLLWNPLSLCKPTILRIISFLPYFSLWTNHIWKFKNTSSAALFLSVNQPSFDKILRKNQSTKLLSTKGIPFKQKVLQKRNNLYKKKNSQVRENMSLSRGLGNQNEELYPFNTVLVFTGCRSLPIKMKNFILLTRGWFSLAVWPANQDEGFYPFNRGLVFIGCLAGQSRWRTVIICREGWFSLAAWPANQD